MYHDRTSEYQFKVCGALTVVFIEVKLSLGTSTERLNTVAQVIAEANGIPPLLLEISLPRTPH